MGRLKTLDDWLKYQENLHPQAIDLGLERIQNVYEALFPNSVPFKVITIAGTNGKGSTAAFIHSIYQHANIKVAKFTSPHILRYNERFVINKTANDQQICNAFEQIETARGNTSLTYFEFSTLAALLIFATERVDVVILEVGLGGRLDSVNVVNGDVAVITNIDLDHCDYLGNTREQIGFEKAGIMRKNSPCICADTNPPKSIQQQADTIGAKLEFVSATYVGETGLRGAHQQQNAATAIKVVEAFNGSFPINIDNIKAGIKNTQIKARFETKTVAGKTLIFDGAHNTAAVTVLERELAKDNHPTLAIFSAMKDKNISLMINVIRPTINKWLLVSLDNVRAINIKDLSNQFKSNDNTQTCHDAQIALKIALDCQTYSRIVVFGSFHLIADTIKALDRFK